VNNEHIQDLIGIIKEHKKLNMNTYLDHGKGTPLPENSEAFHECGNSACIAGYMGLLPSFIAMGGEQSLCGIPLLSYEGEGKVYSSSSYSFWRFAGIKSMPLAMAIVGRVAWDSYTCYSIDGWEKWDWVDAVYILKNLEMLDSMDLDKTIEWLSAVQLLSNGDK